MAGVPPTRDPKMLLREVSARIKIKDIKRLYALRDKVAVKWYESGLVGLLFVAALSFLAVVIHLLPSETPRDILIRNFVIGSSVALVLIVAAVLEFLLGKFRAIRRLYEIQAQLLESLDKDLDELRRRLASLETSLPGGMNERKNRAADRPDDPAR